MLPNQTMLSGLDVVYLLLQPVESVLHLDRASVCPNPLLLFVGNVQFLNPTVRHLQNIS